MAIIAVIPARYGSTRLQGKPLLDINGKPMVWWVYERVKGLENHIDSVIVATDDERVGEVCDRYDMDWIMTSKDHDTPTSRICEVADMTEGSEEDYFMFISGDEPLIDTRSIKLVIEAANESRPDAVNAMVKIKHAPDVIDSSNIKVVTNSEGFLLYATRSPLPYPKGGLDFDYMKFVGIGLFSRKALKLFQQTPRGKLESIEECDLLRFIENGVKVKMVEVECESLSIDTPKDLEIARIRIRDYMN